MTRFKRLWAAPLLSIGVAMLPGTTLAETTVAYAVTGAEYAASPGVGHFAGFAAAEDDRALWWATVNYDVPLPTTVGFSTDIAPGGTFELQGATRDASGTFEGGVITLASTSLCGRETYQVTASVIGTMAGSPSGEFAGTFAGTLTHYRTRIFGRCITYAATVVGGVELTTTSG